MTSAPPTVTPSDQQPIRPAPKHKKGRKRKNIFYDDRGFPDQSDEFDYLLHSIDGGRIIRKRKHPAPQLDVIDPAFHATYNEALHGDRLRKELDIGHLPQDIQTQVYALFIEFWSVFDEKGLFVPVKDYECVIDTGSARPISVSKINYGPREIPIMRKCIAALEKLGQIKQISEGGWLFKALLAAKPHQEHITNIADFVWRFCVNYIPLNAVTRVIAYPIPRCDNAVNLAFGDGFWFWLFDAPSGYHQLRVSECSKHKLAFAGPDAIKWTYNVMPFGPVNGPQIFISFAHDMDSTWKELATQEGISIGSDTNTRIIVDDIFNWAKLLKIAFHYMRCQLRVCQAQNLSLSLKKTHIFPKRMEFVGIDLSQDGNRPAMSKHQLLTTWPNPTTVCDISSFIGFINFYASYIPHLEMRASRLREITKLEMTELAAPHFDEKALAELEDLKEAVLSDPCLS